jgi:hypothetical protein
MGPWGGVGRRVGVGNGSGDESVGEEVVLFLCWVGG